MVCADVCRRSERLTVVCKVSGSLCSMLTVLAMAQIMGKAQKRRLLEALDREGSETRTVRIVNTITE